MSARAADTIPRKAGRIARWAKRIGAALFLLVVLLAGLYFARGRLIAPLVIERVAKVLRTATGLELKVARIDGSWFSDLELVDVDLSGGTPSTELVSLKLARATARFDLLGLLRGDMAALTSIELDSARVVVDLDAPARKPPSPRPWIVNPEPFPWPKTLPPIAARNVAARVELGGGRRVEVQGLNAVWLQSTGPSEPAWRVHAQHVQYSDPIFDGVSGALDSELHYGTGLLEVPRLDLDGQQIARAIEVDLRELAQSLVSFSGTLARYGGEVDFRGALDADDFQIWTDLREVDLSAVLREFRVAQTISGRANLNAVFRAPLAAPDDWNAQASGRIDAPEFQGHSFDQVSFAGSIDRDQLELREGLLLRGANSLTVSNFAFSFAGEGLSEVLRSFRGSAELELFDPRAILGEASPEILAAADRVRRARLALDFSDTGFEVRTADIRSDVGGMKVEHGKLRWGERNLPWYQGLSLDLDAALSFEDLAPLAALFGQGDVKGALAGTVALSGPALAPSGRFLLAGNGLSIFGIELGQVTIEARADTRHVELARLELDGASIQATASGDFDYASGAISNSRLRARTFALDILSRGRASAGLVSIDASCVGPWRDPSLWGHAKAWGFEYDGRTIEELEVEGSYAQGCARFDRLLALVNGVAVDAAGRVCRSVGGGIVDVSLERARLARDELDLSLEAPLEVVVAKDAVIVRGLCVGGSAGHAIADLSWTPLEQSVSIEASELVPMHLLRPFLPAGVVIEGVHGSFEFHRSPTDIAASADLRVDELQLFAGSPRAALDFSARLAQRELVIRQLVVTAPDNYGIDVSGRIATDPLAGEWVSDGPFELAGVFHVFDFASLPRAALGISNQWRGAAAAEFRLSGTSSDVRGAVTTKINLSGSPMDSVLGPGNSGAFQFEATATIGDEIYLEHSRLSLPDRGSADIDGHVTLRVDLKSWAGGVLPDWKALPVSLGAKVSLPELGFLAGMSPSLRRTGGELHGDVRLLGTFQAPVLTGSLDVSRAEVKLSNALSAFENLSAHFEFDHTSLRIVSLAGEYGAAPFQAGGTIELGQPQPRLDLRVQGQGLLLAREQGFRLRADADLKLEGALGALKLSGEVTVVDGRFSKNFELVSLPGKRSTKRTSKVELPFLRKAPWADLQFDVQVRAKKPIRVETNIARGTVEPRLELRGSGAAPRLGGTLMIGASRLKLPASTLEVTSGVLTFRGESSLVPDLDITATTRVRGFDITAQVGGTSEDPELLFSSTPPLSREELAILVLTGQLPESALSAQGSTAAMQTVAVFLGQDILSRWLGIDALEEGSEDPITERMEYFQGAEVSQAGIESSEFVFRLTPNPRGKPRIFYLRAEKDVFEKINFGVKLLFRFQ